MEIQINETITEMKSLSASRADDPSQARDHQEVNLISKIIKVVQKVLNHKNRTEEVLKT